MKKVNNNYYIKLDSGEFQQIEAQQYNNKYNLDLFEFRDQYGNNITEAKTGFKLLTGYVSPKGLEHIINNLGGIDILNNMINENILKSGLTPRYKA